MSLRDGDWSDWLSSVNVVPDESKRAIDPYTEFVIREYHSDRLIRHLTNQRVILSQTNGRTFRE